MKIIVLENIVKICGWQPEVSENTSGVLTENSNGFGYLSVVVL